MFVVPAVVIGAFIIFGVGYVLTHIVLTKIRKSRTGNPTYYRDTLVELNRAGSLTDEVIDRYAKIGGGVAVVLLALSLFILPRQTVMIVWAVLTVIGILGGLLTFIIKW